MNSKPQWVTFTGLDERTDLTRAAKLSARYPIEWGVLFGGRLGKNRYPPRYVADLAEGLGLPMAMHLCGPIAEAANRGEAPQNYRAFQRVQVNRAEGQYDMFVLSRLAHFMLRPVIIQHRAPTFKNTLAGLVALQDTSGGKGKSAPFWATPATPEQFVGYAGGIEPR